MKRVAASDRRRCEAQPGLDDISRDIIDAALMRIGVGNDEAQG